MTQTLRAAVTLGYARHPFTMRLFSRQVGKTQVRPVGLGSALAKAVREGHLRVITDGSRRKGRQYAFTPQGLAYAQGSPT